MFASCVTEELTIEKQNFSYKDSTYNSCITITDIEIDTIYWVPEDTIEEGSANCPYSNYTKFYNANNVNQLSKDEGMLYDKWITKNYEYFFQLTIYKPGQAHSYAIIDGTVENKEIWKSYSKTDIVPLYLIH